MTRQLYQPDIDFMPSKKFLQKNIEIKTFS